MICLKDIGRGFFTSIFVLSAQGALGQAEQAEPVAEFQCASSDESVFRIAVVGRRGTDEYASILRGANDACREEGELNVQLQSYPYDERSAFESVTNLMDKTGQEKPHLILGPTESSVFINLEEFESALKPSIPVISPLVTVRSTDPSASWFFQLNVGAAQRSQKMHQHMESLGVNNIAILYEGDDFGESSEVAFRSVLTPKQESTYQSFRIEPGADENYIPWLRRLATDTRPEAVGIFGSRAVINKVARLIKSLGGNSLFEYKPYLFSTIDLRPNYTNEMYFLTVAGLANGGEQGGEAVALSYDTTKLIFSLVKGIQNDGIGLNHPDFSPTLLSRLSNRMNTDGVIPRSRTRMQFSGFANSTDAQVVQFLNNEVVSANLNQGGRVFRTIQSYFDIRERRFGNAMLINLSLIAVIVLVITARDLISTLSVRVIDLLKPAFALLLIFNILTAIVVFFILAETDLVDATWTSTFSACVVAFGYVGLLNSTIFTTPGGEAVFARRHYENLVKSIYNNIRKRQYERLDPVINYIALANSQNYIRNALIASYGYDRDNAWQAKMTSSLDKALQGKTTIQQRRILAERLLNEMRDKTLQERRIIPKETSRDKVEDPLPVINDVVEKSMLSNVPTLDEAEAMVRKYQVNEDREKEFEGEFDSAGTPRAKYAVCYRWIIILCGYKFFTNWVQHGVKSHASAPAKPVDNDSVDKNQRKQKRAIFDTEAIVECAEENFVRNIVDISVGGCRILTDNNKPDVDEEVVISTKLDQAPVSLDNARGKVVHKSKAGDKQQIVGIEWIDLLPRNQLDLEDYLETLEE